MRFLRKSILFSLSTYTALYAHENMRIDEPLIKQKLKSNRIIQYVKSPQKVEQLSKVLTDGIFYGRIRINEFIYDADSKIDDHQTIGIGGSLIYKTANYKGFSYTSGFYLSQSLGDANLENHRYGKDTFSSDALSKDGRKQMHTFAQNYLSFQHNSIEVKLGHFLLESFLLQSHDTKMIPNAFEGASIEFQNIPKVKTTIAYITKQKLRDHEKFHSVLSYSKYDGNDDGVMHRGLTAEKLEEKGIDDKILLFEVQNSSLTNSKFRLGYTSVPKLISSIIVESSHKFKMTDNFNIETSIRYMQQFDEGAGEIGGANIKNNTQGYDHPNSLDASLFASKIDFNYKPLRVRFGYSNVADQGDIVAPWHGLPTAGYSRAMSTMNWYANTETFMVRADYDFPKSGLLEGLHLMSRYALNNFDDHKSGVSSDMDIFTLDLNKNFKNYPNVQVKLRSIIVKENHKVQNQDGSYKKDPSYNALRLELNYLF